MLDRYWHGDTRRISPEAPVPVVHVTGTENRLGGAANVGRNVAALGGAARVAGLVGDDANGRTVAGLLREAGCDVALVTCGGWETITKLRVLSHHQQLIRLDSETPPPDRAADLAARVAACLGDAGIMVLSDYAKGALQRPAELIALAREADIPVVVDPKRIDVEAYRGATVITPNRGEFEAIVGSFDSDAELEQRARRLIDEMDLGAVLVTRSEQGMTLVERAAPCLHLPTTAREVFDVTGAGDTVVASLSIGIAAGLSLADAAALANLAAGVVVGKLGTAVVTGNELRRAVADQHPDEHGVLSEAALQQYVRRARDRGERIVMTNGCFDILHPGHVAYLEQAASMGDRLIVAVNDDASVGRLKGDGRPVNPLAQRMAVLAGLRSVDWVVPFSEDTPERLVCEVRPDLLVKGGDYSPDAIAGARCVREAGGEVRVLEFVDGFSTTAIIRSLDRSTPD